MDNLELLGTRVVNHRRDEEDIYIGRGSIYGNPFTHLPMGATKALFQVATRQDSINEFEKWVFTQPQILSRIWELKGKRLGCYCHPLPCHGQVLVYLVATYQWMRDIGIEPDWESTAGVYAIRVKYRELVGNLQKQAA